jgi:hypothetical protein
MSSTAAEVSPKDFFMRLLAMVTLYIFVVSFIDILYQYINGAFPDPLLDNFSFSILSLRWDIASFIVTFPVFLYTTKWLNQECRLYPEKLNLKSRKWLINSTLFLAALIIMCDLGTLLYYFLGAEVTVRFLLKVLVLLLVVGLVFYYYLRDLKQKWTAVQLKGLFWIVVVIAAVVIGYSIYKTQKPFLDINKQPIAYCKAKTLAVTADEDKVIQQLVRGYAIKNGCEIGSNCLNKWRNKDVTKFSIAWSSSCVGAFEGGSTFQCSYDNQQTCCWPLGYAYGKICSPTSSR